MAVRHLFRLLACASLQLALRGVTAGLTKGATSWDPIMKRTCPVLVKVEDGYDLANVPLQESQEFHLTPNLPQMSIRFLQGDISYKVTVDGTMVNLVQCDERENNCTVFDEGGKKDRDYLMPNKMNKILVNYTNDEVTLVVNGRINVMRGRMRMTKVFRKGGGGGDGYITFLVPPTRVVSYSATVQILCSGAPPQIQTEAAPPTQPAPIPIAPALPQGPYKQCPLYMVEANHPSIPAVLDNDLTLAVNPSHPILHLVIENDYLNFKVHVSGPTAELLRCNKATKQCSSLDTNVIEEEETFIIPGRWNNVTISLSQDEIIISINDRKGVLVASLQSTDQKGLKVIALAPQAVSIGGQEHFVVRVNVKCEVIEQKMVTMVWPDLHPTRAPRKEGQATNAPIVDVTGELEPDAPGISRTVIIIVGVLVGVLFIIALAIIISSVKKRRSAAITETSPLQNQEQTQKY